MGTWVPSEAGGHHGVLRTVLRTRRATEHRTWSMQAQRWAITHLFFVGDWWEWTSIHTRIALQILQHVFSLCIRHQICLGFSILSLRQMLYSGRARR